MLHKLTPKQYEKGWRIIYNTFWSIVGVFVFSSGYLILTAIIYSVFGIELTQNMETVIAMMSLFLGVLTTAFIVFTRVFYLHEYRFIYWWVVLFGHAERYDKLLDKFKVLIKDGESNPLAQVYHRYSIKHSSHEAFEKFMIDNHAGLFYISDSYRLRDKTEIPKQIHFASKKCALAVKLLLPDLPRLRTNGDAVIQSSTYNYTY